MWKASLRQSQALGRPGSNPLRVLPSYVILDESLGLSGLLFLGFPNEFMLHYIIGLFQFLVFGDPMLACLVFQKFFQILTMV